MYVCVCVYIYICVCVCVCVCVYIYIYIYMCVCVCVCVCVCMYINVLTWMTMSPQSAAFLSQDALITVIHALVTSRIDYFNSLLYGIADYNINRQQ